VGAPPPHRSGPQTSGFQSFRLIACPGAVLVTDLTLDCRVNGDDLWAFADAWSQGTPLDPTGEGEGDLRDLVALERALGGSCAP